MPTVPADVVGIVRVMWRTLGGQTTHERPAAAVFDAANESPDHQPGWLSSVLTRAAMPTEHHQGGQKQDSRLEFGHKGGVR